MAQRHRRVIWTAQAQLALGEALDYIAQESVDGARAVLNQALAAASGLETLSERGRILALAVALCPRMAFCLSDLRRLMSRGL